jgi:hypothetical protein
MIYLWKKLISMSPKIKSFLIYGVSFTALFLISRFIVSQFMEQGMMTMFIPIAVAMIISPKPHIEETENGREYGLKSIFLKKPFKF